MTFELYTRPIIHEKITPFFEKKLNENVHIEKEVMKHIDSIS